MGKKKSKNLPIIIAIAVLAVTVILIFCCIDRNVDWGWNYGSADVVVASDQSVPEKLDIDLYLDHTISMQGFAFKQGTNYSNFISELENTAQSSWKKTTINYYKFAAVPIRLTNIEYLGARQPVFYNGLITNIDSVIDRSDSSKLSVVVTDLFQDKQNIGAIVKQLKERCLMKGIAIGILCIKSEFSGTVYDASFGSFPYASNSNVNSWRPFYAIMFGKAVNIVRLYNNLAHGKCINGKEFILISDSYVKKYDIDYEKPKSSKSLSIKQKKLDIGKAIIKMGEDEEKLFVKVNFEPLSFVPVISKEMLSLDVSKKTALNGKISKAESSSDVALSGIAEEGLKKFKHELKISNNAKQGKYSYQCYFQINTSAKVKVPSWVSEVSATTVTQSLNANKTLNLEEFVADLVRASWVVYNPKIGKFYIDIVK